MNTRRFLILASGIIWSAASIFSFAYFYKSQKDLENLVVLSMHQKSNTPITKLSSPAKIISANGDTWLDIQKQVKDTVVQIFAQSTEFNWLEPYKSPEQNEGSGSGFFINDKGDIVTNYHVVMQATSIQIQIPASGMERFDAEIIGASPERDIALLRLTKEDRERITRNLKKIPYLKLGDSDDILRSQEVLALGYPLGQIRLKSTLGIVSGRERIGYFGYIQITAPLNPGNSGGPALDTSGKVIGINSRAVLDAQNVGYIIPINEVKSALNDLHKVKLLRKPVLGCIFTASTPDMVSYLGNPGAGGWYIAHVFENTLLEGIGIKEGDMLYEINGFKVDLYGEMVVPWSEDKVSLFELLNRYKIGDPLVFVIYRKGKRIEFKFKLEIKHLQPIRVVCPEFEKEATDYEIFGGLVVMQLTLNHINLLLQRAPELIKFTKTELLNEPALIITHVLPNSQAAKSYVLRPGAIIESVNGQEVKTLKDYRSAIQKSKTTRFITIRTAEKFYAVLSLNKILREEDLLSARYFYKKSKLLDENDKKKA